MGNKNVSFSLDKDAERKFFGMLDENQVKVIENFSKTPDGVKLTINKEERTFTHDAKFNSQEIKEFFTNYISK